MHRGARLLHRFPFFRGMRDPIPFSTDRKLAAYGPIPRDVSICSGLETDGLAIFSGIGTGPVSVGFTKNRLAAAEYPGMCQGKYALPALG